mmetsp:Transcript_34963/g.38679  ORF Transcript_34963/g.38679 Transcript_34963/m.38679 type:complete len:636 (+) Transcript_34963:106-2013(+)
MGNRIKGKVKKKSIKAAKHSGMGSKRKLSRMGKNQGKNLSGLDATFIGRSKVLRKLQISLKDFRRLCILKGVYPREPRGRAPSNRKGQTYYHRKDMMAIAHEPVLHKFREFASFMKHVRKAAGRNEKDEAKRMHATEAPTYTLHHLVRERYPRFDDALNDLDDALTLVFLFAALPCEKDIRSKVVNKAKSLAGSWAAYCATTSSITKSFVSVKGVYVEAYINQSTLRWIVPHSFTQTMPDEVDYKVMLTFFEFHETLLSFVLFKLYNQLGLRYPLPITDVGGEGTGNTSTVIATNLNAMKSAMSGTTSSVIDSINKRERSTKKDNDDKDDNVQNKEQQHTSKKARKLMSTVGAALTNIKEDDENNDGEDEDDENVEVAGPLKAALESMEDENLREVSGLVLDEEATKRKRLFAGFTFFLSREIPRGYIELVCLSYGGRVGWESSDSSITASDPSITHHIVDRPKVPKDLLSKFANKREFIQPQWILDCANFMFLLPVSRYSIGAELPPHLSPWVDDEEEGYKPAYAEEIERLKNGDPLVEDDDEDDEVDKKNVSDDDDDDDVDEVVVEEKAKKAEIESAKESEAMAKVMMSRKATRLYNRMQHGIAQKQSNVDELRKRRREIEEQKKDTLKKSKK